MSSLLTFSTLICSGILHYAWIFCSKAVITIYQQYFWKWRKLLLKECFSYWSFNFSIWRHLKVSWLKSKGAYSRHIFNMSAPLPSAFLKLRHAFSIPKSSNDLDTNVQFQIFLHLISFYNIRLLFDLGIWTFYPLLFLLHLTQVQPKADILKVGNGLSRQLWCQFQFFLHRLGLFDFLDRYYFWPVFIILPAMLLDLK